MTSVVLLGDSVFDNKAYTSGGPDVAEHLRGIMPPGTRVTLCAVDGTTTTDLGTQLDRVPKHATDLVLSLGGNDALMNADLLALPCRSTGEALDLFRERLDEFEQAYRSALDAVLDLGRRTIVCTIYNGDLPEVEARRARVALMTFNDVILRHAFQRRLDVLDVRLVCVDAGDFANQIEPSAAGGQKIAHAVALAVCTARDPSGPTIVTAGRMNPTK